MALPGCYDSGSWESKIGFPRAEVGPAVHDGDNFIGEYFGHELIAIHLVGCKASWAVDAEVSVARSQGIVAEEKFVEFVVGRHGNGTYSTVGRDPLPDTWPFFVIVGAKQGDFVRTSDRTARRGE